MSELKKKWKIQVSQNGWEYSGWVLVTASTITLVGEKTILADGVLVEFDEEIGTIESTDSL